MRKQLIGAASVAILASVVLAGCNFGNEKKEDAGGEQAAAGAGADADAGEASSGGKPATGAAAEGAGESAGADAGSPKPEDGASEGGQGGSDAGASRGSSGSSGGGSTAGVQTIGDVPDDFAELMTTYLDHYVENFGQGLSAFGQRDVVTALRAGEEYRWTVNLEQGRSYGFFGACDNDCNDVDIIIEDANGREVASDVLTDDYPVVAIQNATAGRYTARILLVNCEIEPCYVGARVLRQ